MYCTKPVRYYENVYDVHNRFPHSNIYVYYETGVQEYYSAEQGDKLDQQYSANVDQTKEADSGSKGNKKIEEKKNCDEEIEYLGKVFADDFDDYFKEDDFIHQHDNNVTSNTVVSF